MYKRPSPTPIRVVIADDHCLFRAGVRALLDEEDGIEVVAELEDGSGVLEAVRRTAADVVLLELDMPHVDGYEVLQQLHSADTNARAIVLTGVRDAELLSQSLALGALGIVAKKGATRGLMESIRAVSTGLRWLDPSLKVRLHLNGTARPSAARAARKPRPGSHRCDWGPLTAREREVAELVAAGHRYKEVAQRLQISKHTLKNHLRHIFDKLQIRSRVQLALHGVQREVRR